MAKVNKKIEIDKSLKIRTRVNYRNTKWKTVLKSVERVESRKVFDENGNETNRRRLVFVHRKERFIGDEQNFEIEIDLLDLINVMDSTHGRISHDYEQAIVKQRDDQSKPKKKTRLKRK